jgi:uncharacterized protein YciI
VSGELYVVQMETAFTSLADVQRDAAETLATHVARCHAWHEERRLLLAGAFLDRPGEPVQTMAVLPTRADADEFAAGDPFAVAGMITSTAIRPWANLLGV